MANRHSTNGKPLVLSPYIRMSSSKQEASPDQQREEIAKLCGREGYTLGREYFDSAISGDEIEERPDFCRMIEDASRGDFDLIGAFDQSRFGRMDALAAGRVIEPLREAGVRLVTCGEGMIDWETFEGRIVYMVSQEGKHAQQRDISRNSLRGKLAAVKHQFSHGMPAYAYDRLYYDESGQFVKRVAWNAKFRRPERWTCQIEPSEDASAVDTIRGMFGTFAARDTSLAAIVRDLNGRKISTRHGGLWCVATVRNILTNPTYIGHERFGKMARGKFHRVGDDGEICKVAWYYRKQREYRIEPLFVRKNAHAAIVDEATFEIVQKKLAARSIKRTKPRESPYLLSGLMTCGHCGKPMSGTPSRVGTQYYRCNGNHGTCKKRSVRLDQIEAFVIKTIQAKLLSPAAIKSLRAELAKQIERQTRKLPAVDIKRLKSAIAKLDTKIERGAENLLLADPDNFAAMQATLNGWRQERDELAGQFGQQTATAGGESDAKQLIDSAIAELYRLRDRLVDADKLTVRDAIKRTIGNVSIWWEPAEKRGYRVKKGVVELCGLLEKAPSGN